MIELEITKCRALMAKTKESNDHGGVDVLFGMVQAFFLWILSSSTDDKFIAKCFRDILDYFVRYEIPAEYLGAFMINSLKENTVSIADLEKLELVLKQTGEKPENVEAVSFLIEQARQYFTSQN